MSKLQCLRMSHCWSTKISSKKKENREKGGKKKEKNLGGLFLEILTVSNKGWNLRCNFVPTPSYKKILVFPRLIGGGITYNYFPPTEAAIEMEEIEMVVFEVSLNCEKTTKLLSAKFDIVKFCIKDL